MAADRVTELRRRLVTAKHLPDIFDYFCENFSDEEAFWDRGNDCTDRVYANILAVAARSRFGTDIAAINIFRQHELPDIKMVHGFYEVNGMKSHLFYFTDIDAGMCCIYEPGGMTHYMRINLTPTENPASKTWASVRQ